MICTLEDPIWVPGHAPYLDQLSRLWMITRSAGLYVLWTTRNKMLIEDQAPPITSVACYKAILPVAT
ncbi:Hypothetical protein PHPALM_14027 [Phytophthora palmivora]|uniref:Uncharacterized protein n=1 Tax=Phytophthora palmivora TaxID=4796 RepID=A0A2P4XVT7_9STRA|nr:Hypothetical protein PHPALM_14027 [Phytophthora palmivora]